MTNKPKKLTDAEARKVKDELTGLIGMESEDEANIDRALGAIQNAIVWLGISKAKKQKKRDKASRLRDSIRGEEE